MGSAQWLLEVVLVLLLGTTLFHAVRLERALGVLKRDRAVLEGLVESFNESTRQAESGIEHLRSAADGAGRQMARQIEQCQRLRDDLSFLSERGEKLAERVENSVRSARMFADNQPFNAQRGPVQAPIEAAMPSRSVSPPAAFVNETVGQAGLRVVPYAASNEPPADMPRLRSQAERDLLLALRAGRVS